MFKSVDLKLANMRKPQNFVVQDVNDKDKIIIQSDKSIGIFDKKTGKGKLNTKGCYFPHLPYATPYALSMEQLKECLQALYIAGDVLGTIAGSTIINCGITTF